MKANELRIGNYAMQGGRDIRQVDENDWFYELSHHINFIGYEPIPLTEEWLVKFGFKEYNLRYRDITSSQGGGDIRFMLLENRGVYKIQDDLWSFNYVYFNGQRPDSTAHIKYVHQLQNLYFALTGEELTIKDK